MLKRAAGKIYGWIEPHMDNDKKHTNINRVYICTDAAARDKCAEMYTDIIAKILLAFLVTCILAVILVAKDAFAPHKVVLTRDGYGGDVSTVTLETDIDGEKTDFDVDVMPLEYDPDDMEAVFEQGFGEIEDLYLGENESPDEVIYDLELVDHLDALGLDVQWISEDNELVSSDGRIGDIAEGEDRIVSITAVLTYRELSAERTYQIRVCGREETGREKALKEQINGYAVRPTSGGGSGLMILFLGGFAAICIWGGNRSKIRGMEKKRSDELMSEYPELVDKLTLYLGAGVTVRGAFARIVKSGREDCAGTDQGGSVLTRELIYTLNEIQAGVSESEAYYNMGHRINLPMYIKLMSLLSQNVKKGTRDILIMMAGEEQNAMQTRKEMAKRKGEEAGTKLLLPMVVLLGVVMVIVMLPAIINF